MMVSIQHYTWLIKMRLNKYAEHLVRMNGILVSYSEEDGGDGILTPEFSSSIIITAAISGLQLLLPVMGDPFTSTLSTVEIGRDEVRKIVTVDINDEEIANVSTRFLLISSLSFFVEALRDQLGQKSIVTLPNGRDRNAILIDADKLRDPTIVHEAIFNQLIGQDNPLAAKVIMDPTEAKSLSEMFNEKMRRR